MADRNHPVTLTSPLGFSVKCAANKRYALATHVVRDGETRLVVLLRTNDPKTAIQRGKREAKARGAQIGLHFLSDGRLWGHWTSSGVWVSDYSPSKASQPTDQSVSSRRRLIDFEPQSRDDEAEERVRAYEGSDADFFADREANR